MSLSWKNNQATGILVPAAFFPEQHEDSILPYLAVKLSMQDAVPMMGNISRDDDTIIFQPLVPLSGGLTYDIFYRDKKLGSLLIPDTNNRLKARLINIYPTTDTVPENLLKIYLHFATPMREGEAERHIAIIDDRNDTLKDIFLDLKPELWNDSGTTLTLWLDPGRIKRDLIPNRQLGNPLKKGKQYSIIVSNQWKDKSDRFLEQSYEKSFTVSGRDSLSPDVDDWRLTLPEVHTYKPLTIRFNESLDYFLLQETIHIIDANKNIIEGRMEGSERVLRFTPGERWSAGNYTLVVAGYLEDLAGNNFSRPFDKDLQSTIKKSPALTRRFRLPAPSIPGEN